MPSDLSYTIFWRYKADGNQNADPEILLELFRFKILNIIFKTIFEELLMFAAYEIMLIRRIYAFQKMEFYISITYQTFFSSADHELFFIVE